VTVNELPPGTADQSQKADATDINPYSVDLPTSSEEKNVCILTANPLDWSNYLDFLIGWNAFDGPEAKWTRHGICQR
jgi:hypothetical protein